MRARDAALGFGAGVLMTAMCAAGVLHAQAGDAVAPTPTVAMPRATVQVPGSVQVTRMTDTQFVVVKDQGDAQVVTLFTTESGLIQKKHSGRFLY